ncbi:hypothetical protein CC78DRAFT_132035 [Lojkania enalia]|uniref:Ankyrin repeat protein n=1 Tax=Lojkania enalia TaxID=147567 RepID=A0A9P4TRI6_9PLEO|nr:hypothetical protein CC78DRAFT_132035 [Didymosphaeria enalia]
MADTISTATTATFPTSARSSADIVNAGIQPIFRSTIVEDPTEPPTPEPAVRPSLSWKSFRSSISVSEKTMAQLGWIIAFLSVLLTIVALSPAFKSQNASEKALRIAEWTALKDFIEECREELAAGIHSQACVRAMNTTLPPPPYATSGLFDRIKRGTMTRHEENNGTARAVHIDYRAGELKLVVQWLIFCAICLTACGFLFINFEHNRSHISRNRRQLYADTAWKGLQADDITHSRPSIESNPTTIAAIRHPPPSADANLRRRAIRRHPIYRYSNLEEAIHHSDMTEIRARLCNGEDVNEHWPYLIYRLAISPPSSETEKRIEVARLCLDFGADVNALKGWNG